MRCLRGASERDDGQMPSAADEGQFQRRGQRYAGWLLLAAEPTGRTKRNSAPFSGVREVTLLVGVKRDKRGKKGGYSPSGTLNAFCSVPERGQSGPKSGVQYRWTITPDKAQQLGILRHA